MLNQAQVIGYLGRDPEVRFTQSGDAIATLNIATSEKWKDKQTGEQKEATEWHRVVFYGAPAQTIEKYTQKGTLLYVSGKLTTRKWTDKQGIEKYTTEIQGRDFKILREGKGAAQQGAGAKQGHAPSHSSADPFDDDIPF
jgi:single-strand DNA-binding protein